MRKILVPLFLSLFLLSNAIAQKVEITSAEADWEITPVFSPNTPTEDIYHLCTSKNSILTYANSGSIVPVRFEKKSFGFVFIDTKGTERWRTATKGRILGQSKLGENILCVYSPDPDQDLIRQEIKTVYAGLYDSKNGKLIKEQVIADGRDEGSAFVYMLSLPDQQFGQLLIRYASAKRVNKTAYIFSGSFKLKVFLFSHSLEVTQKDLSSTAVNGFFENCSNISADEFVVTSRNENLVTTEKFNVNAPNKPEVFTINLNANGKSKVLSIASYSLEQPGIMYQAFRYENDDKQKVIALYKTDLKTKKTTFRDMTMDKQMGEDLENDPDAGKSKIKKHVDDMDLMDIAILKDEVLLMTQIRYVAFYGSGQNGSLHDRFRNDQIIISTFNGQLNKVRSKLIDRQLETFGEAGMRAGWKIQDNKLYLLCNVNDGIGFGAEYTILDLARNSVTKHTELQRGNLNRAAMNVGDAVIWSESKALIPYKNMALLSNKGNMVFQLVSLNDLN